jgi:hypothetical protein
MLTCMVWNRNEALHLFLPRTLRDIVVQDTIDGRLESAKEPMGTVRKLEIGWKMRSSRRFEAAGAMFDLS